MRQANCCTKACIFLPTKNTFPTVRAGVADEQVMDASVWSSTKPPCILETHWLLAHRDQRRVTVRRAGADKQISTTTMAYLSHIFTQLPPPASHQPVSSEEGATHTYPTKISKKYKFINTALVEHIRPKCALNTPWCKMESGLL